MTLLVLELTTPALESGSVAQGLLDQWPEYLAYLVSFASIGAAWVAHAAVTDHIAEVDAVFFRLNLLLLLFVSVLPFPTGMIGAYLHDADAERVAVTIYGVNLLAISATMSVLWRYAVAERLTHGDRPEERIRAVTVKLDPSLAVYVVAIGIGLVAPIAAVILYLVIALFLLIPFRTIVRHIRGRPER
ncbi:MAG TPA: TMEM175 family protein [Actinomycetota bacterium]|nr:TMEM175 family protein [Actinomycetota bacterium]